ncbi:MAG TPA: methionine gamma-lyase family protein [Candidatus Eremiobacteraceae bacterium]|nr:methionine gamma-lyase family protein [Candidatus Eremiobacteraceae bacterium]
MIDQLRAALALFDLPGDIVGRAVEACETAAPSWAVREANAVQLAARTVKVFSEAGITDAHLQGTVGYGYHDFGREAYEAILAQLVDSEAALARVQLVSGTQAIVASIAALAGAEGTICSLTGKPYDTLRLALTDHPRALRPRGEGYVEVAWAPGRALDEGAAAAALSAKPAVAFIQRSRGYAPRPSASIEEIARLVALCKRHSPSTAVIVDNCYGEFVEPREPGAVGADVVVGSLIKNPGGGMATTGAYVAGTREAIERIAEYVFAPGLGSRIGPSLEAVRSMYAGLHRAPRTVAESLKTMDFAAALFARLGYDVDPKCGDDRTDIIQAIRLGSRDKLERFAHGLQRMLPVNPRARPEPGPVPGYADPVIMAGGAFITGSTIELSCDAPLREPFEVYLQGGMDLVHGIIAVTSAAAAVGVA